MSVPILIYCGGGNPRFYQIATEAGFMYGSQLPDTVYGPLYFADQDWKNPNREIYMQELAIHRPFMASVLDWERLEQLPEVLAWAEEAAQWVETVMIIPKAQRAIHLLPKMVGGKPIRLGYSVPTKYGGTALPYSDFRGWDIHLLGGSPHAQRKHAKFLNVVSTDGNMMMKMATRFAAFYDYSFHGGKHTHWPTILDVDGKRWGNDAPYEAFRRSCQNIMQFWKTQ